MTLELYILIGFIVAIVLYWTLRRVRNRHELSRVLEKDIFDLTINDVKILWPEVKFTNRSAADVLARHTKYRAQILAIQEQSESWGSDDMTQPQARALKGLGIVIKDKRHRKKGVASKLIGMFGQSDSNDILKFLAFFDIDTDDLSETIVNIKYQELRKNPDAMKIWESRPADEDQRFYAEYHDVKLPRDAVFNDAEEIIQKHQRESLTEKQLDEWEQIIDAWHEIQDPEYRDLKGIKRPTKKQFMAAVKDFLDSTHYDGECLDEDRIIYFLTLRSSKLKQQ